MGDTSQCSFCLSEDDDRKYLGSEHNDACVCSKCAMMFAHYMLKQQEQDSEDESEESGSETITAEDVFEWMGNDSERDCFAQLDAQLIANNDNLAVVMQTLPIYLNYLLGKAGHHEDYMRDATQFLVQENSPFTEYFVDAYKASHDPDMSDEQAQEEIDSYYLAIEDLNEYFSNTDNVDDNVRFNYIFNLLSCMAGQESVQPPKKTGANQIELIKQKMAETFEYLLN